MICNFLPNSYVLQLHRYGSWQGTQRNRTKTRNPNKHKIPVFLKSFWSLEQVTQLLNSASVLMNFHKRIIFLFIVIFMLTLKGFSDTKLCKNIMKCLEFQRRKGHSKKFIIKAGIFSTTPPLVGIFSSHF